LVPEELNSTVAPHACKSLPAGLCTEIFPNLTLGPIDSVEIYRHIGYPRDTAPASRIEERIAHIVAEALPCLKPRGLFTIYEVSQQAAHSLKLDNTTISGNIGEYLEHADRAAVFAVTVGEEITLLAELAAKDGDALAALVIDAAGSCAVEGAADALMLHLRRHLHEGQELTLRYSPGYCGMDISQQRKLFQLVPASSVGVTLTPSMLMHPMKSISGLVGLAPKEAVSAYRSPCDLCQRVGCHMRR
jgi:cobalamin-dependent methionine synthase I